MMSTARLREIYRQEQNHRKFACVRNDLVRTQQENYAGYIEKEKQESMQKNQKAILVTRKNVVRRHVLEKCMKNKRKEMEKKQASKLYGQYNGVPMEEIAGEIDGFIEQNHPRLRRKKKIEELFTRGYKKGALLNTESVRNKVDTYFEKPLVQVHVEHKSEVTLDRGFLPTIDTSKAFYTENMKPAKQETESTDTKDDEKEEKLFVKRKVSKYLTEDIPDNMSITSDVMKSPKVTSTKPVRPITLPPIKIGTDNSGGEFRRSDSIADIISRINYAKEKREREAKLKKEKREKRILAEKVRGVGHGVISDMERELFTKKVPLDKTPGFLNLTGPVLSHTNPRIHRRRGNSEGHSSDVTNDVSQTLDDVGDTNMHGRLILPPLKVKT